ncbi:poly(R)-hydroxyalkanoic acid synthase subunit PhaE [Rhizobium leguminosarum]|uniref:poly(R)-hydroxyalkanoic acid synthase subunit PhaE n=1 Tax=Rhizobium leguminosarum TaxID=384 RepID=UPI001FEE2394|nr:poly(R)-hydroxyalkanoic acid synthase subunit PhaE [Rhizobium leguminosarum]
MLLRMSEMWRSSMEQAGEIGKMWFNSMMPFLTTRAADNSLFAAAQCGEISKTIRHMVEAPRLADMWNLDRQVYALMAASMDVGQRMAAYHAIASLPWSKAYERYSATLADTKEEDAKDFGWRKAFKAWSAIANEELISNKRSKDFLAAQRDLLRAGLNLRTCQQQMTDSVAKLLGVPSQHDFDELTRQFTELRRELRASIRAQRDEVEGARGFATQPGKG